MNGYHTYAVFSKNSSLEAYPEKEVGRPLQPTSASPPLRDNAPKAAQHVQFVAVGGTIACNWSITPSSTNTQACFSSIDTLKT